MSWAAVDTAQVEGEKGGRLEARRVLYLLGLVILLLSAVRSFTGASDLTSSNTYGAALRLAVPILLAGLGGLYAERTGVVNIGLEGMMILGTWFGAWGGVEFGAWWGVVLGILGGAMGGLVHAVATVSFGVNQIVSGVAVNILAAGVTRFLSVIAFTGHGGGATQSPQVTSNLPNLTVPVLAGGKPFGWQSPDLLGWFERQQWFLVSDVAALFRGFMAELSILTVITLLLVPATYFFLWRTRLGLRMRSAGENPVAAESLGVPVYTMKYLGVVISGALAGLAGAFLVLEAAGIYREGQTGGRGFIGLAAMIFGNWRPTGVAAAAGLFGYTDALNLRSAQAVHALLLFAAIALLGLGVWYLVRGRISAGLLSGAFGVLVFVWYAVAEDVPRQFISITPYVATLLVLAVASQRLRPPAADGLPYRRGQQTS
ncbi:MAG TPA: ABC transporter permease [Actinomycetota bacterium]|jgi:simple sugar transport system permease protein|nr:ABC transporter permease [Actinomycetota bacterium]